MDAETAEDLEWEHDEAVEGMLARLQDKSAFAPIQDPHRCRAPTRLPARGVAWLQYLESLPQPLPRGRHGPRQDPPSSPAADGAREDRRDGQPPPTLIIAPTSVLGNWRKEIERFAPQPNDGPPGSRPDQGRKALQGRQREHDVVLTSFALARLDEKLLKSRSWHRVVVDEAQNIKNPQAAQTKAILKLGAAHRLALTGTRPRTASVTSGRSSTSSTPLPSARRPSSASRSRCRSTRATTSASPSPSRSWPSRSSCAGSRPTGGSSTTCRTRSSRRCSHAHARAGIPLRGVVKDVERKIEELDGMERRGLILATLMRLKQICNHPAQFLADGSTFTPSAPTSSSASARWRRS